MAEASMRTATAADLPALLGLERACYPPASAYGAEEYAYALRRAHAVNLVLEREGRLVGFAGAFLHDGRRAGNVFTVNVHPDERGRGHGRRLLDALEERMRAAGMRKSVLEVSVGNAPAIALYRAAGYEVVERLPDYYATWRDRDAFRMAKSL